MSSDHIDLHTTFQQYHSDEGVAVYSEFPSGKEGQVLTTVLEDEMEKVVWATPDVTQAELNQAIFNEVNDRNKAIKVALYEGSDPSKPLFASASNTYTIGQINKAFEAEIKDRNEAIRILLYTIAALCFYTERSQWHTKTSS